MSEYRFEAIDLKNIKDIAFLMKDVYNRNIDLKTLENKISSHLIGKPIVGFIAYNNRNMPVASIAGFPMAIRNGKSVEYALQLGWGMTNTFHRKKGLYSMILSLIKKEAICQKYNFIFGIPNANALNAIVNEGFNQAFDIQNFNFFVITFPGKWLGSIYLRYVKIVLSLISTTFSEEKIKTVSNNYTFIKDKSYFDYKNQIGDKYFINFWGLKIWVKISGYNLQIGELYSENSAQFTLFKLRILAFILGVVRISFYISKNNPLFTLLLQIKKPKKGLTLVVNNINSEINFSSLNISYSDFDTF